MQTDAEYGLAENFERFKRRFNGLSWLRIGTGPRAIETRSWQRLDSMTVIDS